MLENRRTVGLFSEGELSDILRIKMNESICFLEKKIKLNNFSKENLEKEIEKILNEVIESQKITELSIDENNISGKVNGNNFEINLPYEGEGELFKVSASTRKTNSPEVLMTNTNIIYVIKDYAGKDIKAIKTNFINQIKTRLEFTNKDIKEFNKKLELELKGKAELAKQEILKKIKTLENSGIKIVE